ncbi:Peptidase C19, ubiquitin carboxyl-terminal hydrolase 2 [Penicillium italicum]|uniref:ubiquitinyl hydrolase 1 n=1 Tax=Penicillium italicum TaxID=40296 RepID=A0A0A2KXH5_PENIT|nr:Peptidase C19, ubiquitin carboxyl-terminal hydrolase 2 [Penicillium italicum]
MAKPKLTEEVPEVEDEEEQEEEPEEEQEEEVEEEVEEEELEVADNTEPRTKSGKEKRTLRSVIPNYWHPDFPDKTTVGFPNGGVDCYRNVVFQMFLHMPIFYNWLIWYKEHHAPKGHVCTLGSSEEGPSECQVCQLAEISQAYWEGEAKTWMPTFKSLTHSLLQGWKPAGVDSEQDPAEYFEVLFNAIKNSTKPMMQGDLEDIFQVDIIQAMRCAGKKPCNPKYNPDPCLFMRISLSGEEGDVLPDKPTLSDVIAQHFDHEDDFGVCQQCGGKKTAKEQIGSFPEILLVQLNRTSQTGKKIETKVYLSEQLDIETRFMDERWGNERKVVQYKLTSMVLHHGKDVTRGHYSIGVKGKGDEWTKANDTKISDWDPEGPGGNPYHLATGYLFTYRRLPTDDPVQTQPEPQIAEGDKGTPKPDAIEIDPASAWDDGGVFAGFDSGSVLPESGSPVLGNDPKTLGKFLEMMIPKVVDSYIARSADARRKEWEKWANEWEKKRGTVKAKTSTSAIGSGIGSDMGTGSNEDIVDWAKQRGRLEITLTGDAGKGTKVLDLEVQGMHYNRLKRKKGERTEEEAEDKNSTFSKFKRKVQGKATEYGTGKGKKK